MSTRVYKFRTAKRAFVLMPLPGEDRKSFDRLAGQRIELSSWASIRVAPVRDGSGGDQETDFATVWTEPAISAHAASVLRLVLSNNGQLLPLECEEGAYFAYNVTSMPSDALNEDGSTLHRFSTGRVMSVERYVFRREPIKNTPIFKIPQLPKASAFITQDFVDLVTKAGLTGLDPELVWAE